MESNVYQKENTRYKAAESGKTFHVDDVEDDDDQGDSGRCGVGEGDVCAHEQAICQTPHVITTTVTHCASTQQTFSTPVWSCMVCRWDNNSTNNILEVSKKTKNTPKHWRQQRTFCEQTKTHTEVISKMVTFCLLLLSGIPKLTSQLVPWFWLNLERLCQKQIDQL